MALRRYITLVIIFYLINSSWCSRCPRDVVTEVFSCLANVTGFGGPAPIAGGDVYILQDNCQNGGFKHVVSCIANLYASCEDKKRHLEVLKKLTDVNSIQSSFVLICSQIDVYANSSGCMRLQDQVIKTCVDREYIRFTRGLRKDMSASDIIHQYCRYIIGMSECIENPIREACNEKVADLLAKFMAGLTPPMCTSGFTALKGLHNVTVYFWFVITLIHWVGNGL